MTNEELFYMQTPSVRLKIREYLRAEIRDLRMTQVEYSEMSGCCESNVSRFLSRDNQQRWASINQHLTALCLNFPSVVVAVGGVLRILTNDDRRTIAGMIRVHMEASGQNWYAAASAAGFKHGPQIYSALNGMTAPKVSTLRRLIIATGTTLDAEMSALLAES